MTKRTDWAVGERVESIARTVLMLIAGPGCEAMLLSGSLDSIAGNLARAMLRLAKKCATISTLCEVPTTCLISRSRNSSLICNSGLILPPLASSWVLFKHQIAAFPQSQNNSEAGR
jgi:hypothetical protein